MRIAAATTAFVLALMLRGWAAPSLPERLSDTGLYLSGTTTVDPRHRSYSPQYALWTDGARKSRWVSLPPGTRIDTRDPDRWQFPAGTRFWKEFTFAGRKIETRLLWHRNDGAWSFAAYRWTADQTDAVLVPAEGAADVVEVATGRRHSIPSREDCRACHANGPTPVLGFTALQLSSDRDSGAPHAEPLEQGMVTLDRLVEDDRFVPPRPELAGRPPRIPGDARTRAALGYLSGNCGHCHNEDSWVATVRYPLLMPAYPSPRDVARVIGALSSSPTRWDLPHTAPGSTRFLRAGAPEQSALFMRMRSRRPSSQMPPLGTVVPDAEALELVRAWIRDMAPALTDP